MYDWIDYGYTTVKGHRVPETLSLQSNAKGENDKTEGWTNWWR